MRPASTHSLPSKPPASNPPPSTHSLPPPIDCLHPGALQVVEVDDLGVPLLNHFLEVAAEYYSDYQNVSSAKLQCPQRIRSWLLG